MRIETDRLLIIDLTSDMAETIHLNSLFAADRKNLPALLFATGFAVCHLIFAVVNFIVK